MADEAQVDKLREGVGAWNAWRLDHPDVVPDLSGFDAGAMDLSGVDLRQAYLRDARLGEVVGLLPASLSGTDLTRAELPADLRNFPALEHVAEVSRHARVNFLAVIASCVFCWLTIAQTSDAQLLTGRGDMPLPVINTKVPVDGFFLFAPTILLALYVYLHLYLQRMWDGLSQLPAVFPDGARLDEKAFPWLLSGLTSLYVPRLRKEPPPFATLQVILSVVAAWLLVPATITWFWLRALLFTDSYGIAPPVILLSLAITFGVLFYRRADITLRGRGVPPSRPPFAGRLPALRAGAAPPLLFVTCICFTLAATYGLRLSTVHWHLDFTDEDVTAKAGLDTELLGKLKLLDLKHVSFRHADGRKATLVRVDLTRVDLSFARLDAADLRGSVLVGATLTGAKFVGTNLEGAILAETTLDSADFTAAKSLSQDMLVGACGEGVKLPSGLTVEPCQPVFQVASLETEVSRAAERPAPDEKVEVGVPEGRPGELFRDCDVCPEMVVIPAGEFLMGSPEDENGRFADEGPQHGVRIAAPIAVGRFEVTFAEWGACVADGGCDGDRPDEDWGRGKRPVINVSWTDAQAYVAWLRQKTGEAYRLLSEAEWEYAARAGTTTRYWWGDEISPEDANYGSNIGRTAEVGTYPGNTWGLYDMHGNVWEWVEDCYHDSYQGAPPDGSSWKQGECSLRVLRGGSWYIIPRNVRSAVRSRIGTVIRLSNIGFRVARTF